MALQVHDFVKLSHHTRMHACHLGLALFDGFGHEFILCYSHTDLASAQQPEETGQGRGALHLHAWSGTGV